MAIFIFIQFALMLGLIAGGGYWALQLHRQGQILEDEIRRVNVSAISDFQALKGELDQVVGRLELMEHRIAAFQQYPVAGVNYTQRSQAIRLIRRGETAESISQTLGIPRGQVRLLMKLQVSEKAPKGSAQVAGSS